MDKTFFWVSVISALAVIIPFVLWVLALVVIGIWEARPSCENILEEVYSYFQNDIEKGIGFTVFVFLGGGLVSGEVMLNLCSNYAAGGTAIFAVPGAVIYFGIHKLIAHKWYVYRCQPKIAKARMLKERERYG